MTQHPLDFDPDSKGREPEFDRLSDTWSRADALLEELPRARRHREHRPDATAGQDSETHVRDGASKASDSSAADSKATGNSRARLKPEASKPGLRHR